MKRPETVADLKEAIFNDIQQWCNDAEYDDDMNYCCQLINTRYDNCRCMQQTVSLIKLLKFVA